MNAQAKVSKDWVCLECGKRMTLRRAEKAMSDADGCPGCGGADIDLYVPPAKDGAP